MLYMKLLQYNIYYGNCHNISIDDRLYNICNKIMNIDTDIVCLQEVLSRKYNLIKQYIKSKYKYIYPENISTDYDTIIISKYPFISTYTHNFEYTNMSRNLKIIETKIDNDKVMIATVHFESEFNVNISNKLYQYNKCEKILRKLYNKTNIPIFLCSDTNVCMNTEKEFNKIFNHDKQWRDVWIETGRDKKKEITFNTKTNPILLNRYKYRTTNKYMSRLDRILHISNYNEVVFDIINDTDKILSDHYGITCKFNKSHNNINY